MAKAAKKAKASQDSLRLLSAVEFVSLIDIDNASFPFGVFANGTLTAFDGILAAGIPIEESLTAAVSIERTKAALTRAGQTLSLTVEPDAFWIVSGKLRVRIQLADITLAPNVFPDPNIAPIGDNLKTAMKTCAAIVKDSAPRVVESAILVGTDTCVATDGKRLLESYHGYSLPDIVIPKKAVTAICKQEKALCGFGYTPDTCATFWFEDGSFIRTQLYGEGYPPAARVRSFFDGDVLFKLAPKDFALGVEAIAPHGQTVTFGPNFLTSEGAHYELSDFDYVAKFSADYLLSVLPHCEYIAHTGDRLRFQRDTTRGVLMGMAL